MKKNFFKRVLALTIAASLVVAPTTAFATELDTPVTPSTPVTGDNALVNPVFRVVVPTTLSFATDAFEQKHETGIYSVDFPIINKSNVAVNVSVGLKLTPKAGVQIVANDSDVTETDSIKRAWFAAAVPITTEITETAKAAADTKVGSDTIYEITDGSSTKKLIVKAADKTAAAAAAVAFSATDFADIDAPATDIIPVPFTDVDTVKSTIDYTSLTTVKADSKVTALSTKDATLSFALDKASYTTYQAYANSTFTEGTTFKQMAASQNGSAAFKFVGKLNTNANWLANDIKASAVYTFSGKSDANYTALMAGQVAVGSAKAQALVGVTASANGTAPAVSGDASKLGAGINSDITFDFTMNDATMVTSVVDGSNKALVENTDYTFSVSSGVGTLTLKGAALKNLTADATYTVSFDTFNDSTKCIVTARKFNAPVVSGDATKVGAGKNADVSFAFTMNDATSVTSVTPAGGSALSATNDYTFADGTLTIKGTVAQALTATKAYTVVFDGGSQLTVTIAKEVVPVISGSASKTGAGVNSDLAFAFTMGDATGVTSVTYLNSSNVVTPLSSPDKYSYADGTVTLKAAILSGLTASRTYTVTFNNPSATTITITAVK